MGITLKQRQNEDTKHMCSLDVNEALSNQGLFAGEWTRKGISFGRNPVLSVLEAQYRLVLKISGGKAITSN